MRRVWAGLVFAGWVGLAPAQTPPTRPAPQPAGDILIQKTAGQPDRRLRLLRLDTGPDGERLAEVQDLGTGARYTLPAAAIAGMKRVTPGPADLPPAKPSRSAWTPAAAPTSKFPTSLPLPEPTPGGYSPFTARPLTPTLEPRQRTQPQPVQAAPPVAPASLDTPLTALIAAPAGRPVEPPPTMPKPMPPVAVEPPPLPRPMPPVVEPLFLPAVPEVRPPSRVVMPEVRLREVQPPQPDPSPIRPAAYLSAAPWQMSRSEQMRAEIEPYSNELANALRPSVRERAATALANCRHASHPEVKGLLARTAMTDPAPSVQAHCVRILAALGYHASDYIEFLEQSLGSDHAGLRQAASIALAKLAPR